MDEDGFVVTGISCRLPESDNMEELWENLTGGIDMVTEDDRRWEPGLYDLPKKNGKLKDISSFDATFFGIHPKQANTMDPHLRLSMEVAYEAICDAGLNPRKLRGNSIGVFMASSNSEAHDFWSSNPSKVIGYEMTGCNRAMLSNRLSYYFDFKGPSCTVDTACSSGMVALVNALSAMRDGRCDAALVGGANLLLKPETSLQYMNLKMLSPDGLCKSFDASGNGYTRSEGVVVFLIERKSAAKRIYANVLQALDCCDGFTEQGITFPSAAAQKQLLERSYSSIGLDPGQVTYFEAHGTGTVAGDTNEVNTIAEVCCKTRPDPLLIGSVKSNLGHTEAVAALAGVAKVILSMEHQKLPGNLHYSLPNSNIAGLTDGRLTVVAGTTEWEGGIVGVNSFGMGGADGHAILRSENTYSKNNCDKSRLFVCAGRTEQTVKDIISLMKKNPKDLGLQALLHEQTEMMTSAIPYRGATLLNGKVDYNETQLCENHKRAVWYVFPGMGSQWPNMGRNMMSLRPFAEAIEICHSALASVNFDLKKMLLEGTSDIYADPLNAFIGITSIQVALVDTLSFLGLAPDGMVGHSVGELGCAYADKTLTREQTVLAAYWRGRCIKEANLERGGMAAVGLTWEECEKVCPEGIVPACHNAEKTVTISGPQKQVAEFVEVLKKDGIFAREVDSSGIAFHSYFMKKCGPSFLQALEKVIPQPKVRSYKWISSSVPKEKWDSDLARKSSAEYHANNFQSPVLFHGALLHIPKDAIIIEVGPHGLLQALFKRTLGSGIVPLSLMKRLDQDNVTFIWKNLGKCFVNGGNVNPMKLCPPVQYPVSKGTPMIAPVMHWKHTEKWTVPLGGTNQQQTNQANSGQIVKVSPDLDPIISDHVIDGRNFYPAAGYLVLVWDAFAKISGRHYKDVPISVKNFHVRHPLILSSDYEIELSVTVSSTSGYFEILDKDLLIVDGFIAELNRIPPSPEKFAFDHTKVEDKNQLDITLSQNDFYQELRVRGYDYGPLFQSVKSCHYKGYHGILDWSQNWVTTLDGMIQVPFMSTKDRMLRLPERIQYITIDPSKMGEKEDLRFTYDIETDSIEAGGAKMRQFHFGLPQRKLTHKQPILEEFTFVPNESLSHVPDSVKMYYNLCKKAFEKSQVSTLTHEGQMNGNQHHVHKYGMMNRSVSIPEYGVKLPSIGKIDEKTGIRSNRPKYNGIKTKDYGISLPLEIENNINMPCYSVLRNLTGKKDGNVRPKFRRASVVTMSGGESGRNRFNQNYARTRRASFIGNPIDVFKKDHVIRHMYQPSEIKIFLDLAIENAISRRVKVLHVCRNKYLGLYTNNVLFDLCHAYPHVQIDLDLASPDKTVLEFIVEATGDLDTLVWDLFSQAPPSLKDVDLIVVSLGFDEYLTKGEHINGLTSVLKQDGFLLFHDNIHNDPLVSVMEGLIHRSFESGDPVQTARPALMSLNTDMLLETELQIVTERNDGLLCQYHMWKKMPTVTHAPVVVNIQTDEYDWVEEVKEKLSEIKENPTERVWLLSESPVPSGLQGLMTCLRQESIGVQVRCLINCDVSGRKIPPEFLPGGTSFKELATRDFVMNIFKDGVWGTYRHMPLSRQLPRGDVTHAYINPLVRGDLTSLHWIELPIDEKLETVRGNNIIHICYSALNFRDLMLASGRISPTISPGLTFDEYLGLEFSGVTTHGDKVMGIVPKKGLATTVCVPPQYTWQIPKEWTMKDAATVPVAYCTAFYALVVRGRIKEGDIVLVHSAASSLGQASIRVAKAYKCQVLATVGSKEKKEFLKKEFGLENHQISYSRDVSFVESVMHATKGKGVNIVLNSLSEEKLHASLDILAKDGRFLEVGKFDLSENNNLGMSVFLKNIEFHGILVENILLGSKDWDQVWSLVNEGIQTGIVLPLKPYVFHENEMERALRFMAEGKHIGKIVIQVREESSPSCTKSSSQRSMTPPNKINAIKRTYFNSQKSYIITGGLGGLGMELAYWMVQRGARRLILTSRSGVSNGYQSKMMETLKEMGAEVVTSKKDVCSYQETKDLITTAENMGPLGGIFHLAAVLKDGFFQSQNISNFVNVTKVKVTGTNNLDMVTREVCSDTLDWFVVFSSAASGYGNAGQSNYGFANSYMERICEARCNDGLPGKAIQWGFMGDVGIVQNSLGGNKHYHMGLVPQRNISYLATIDHFLQHPAPVMSSVVPAHKENYDRQPKARSAEEETVVDVVMNILGVEDADALDGDASLSDLGLDSIMTTEIRQVLGRRFDLQLSVAEVQQLTLNKMNIHLQAR